MITKAPSPIRFAAVPNGSSNTYKDITTAIISSVKPNCDVSKGIMTIIPPQGKPATPNIAIQK